MPPAPATSFEEVQAVVADVEGWMTPGQARRLWDLCPLGPHRWH
jgi:hypothetical protein